MHTAPYFTVLGLLAILLSLRVVLLRRKLRVSLGSGGHPELEAAVRTHGNFTEYAPLGLVLLGALEFVQANVWFLHICGGTLLVGRLLHTVALKSGGSMPARVWGMILTWLSIVLSAIGITAFSIWGL